MCCEILLECALEAETEKTVPLVRGAAEIDVYALEQVMGRTNIMLVECKNWLARVPQHVVHSFRTVVADCGANAGYIVSKAGFQSGAYEAAASTNIQLLTWEEFQEEFIKQWYIKHFSKLMIDTFDELDDYLQPAVRVADWHSALTDAERSQFEVLQSKYRFINPIFHYTFPHMRIFHPDIPILPLPLKRLHGCPDEYPEEVTTRTGYREFFDAFRAFCAPIKEEFGAFEALGRSRLTS